MTIDGRIEIRVGNVEVIVDSGPMVTYSKGRVEELKKAVVQCCLAMDTDEARTLATRVEGTQ